MLINTKVSQFNKIVKYFKSSHIASSPGCCVLVGFYVAAGLIFITMVFREYSSPLKVLQCTPVKRVEGPHM